MEVLQVDDLRVWYHTPRGAVRAVDGVSFGLLPEERLGLVGESGSGKSTIALALMRLIRPPGKIEGGEVRLDGVNVLELPDEQMRKVRLASIALVAQGAMNSLNPVVRVREQIVDGMRDHEEHLSKSAENARVASLLEQVGLQPEVADRYPHELSGGMKQRVCIAIAICLRPKVILADEPTSALDVVVQRQVMETLQRVQEQLGALGRPGRPRHGPDGPVRQPPRRHVRRPAGRSLAGARYLRRAAAPVHAAADRQPAVARRARKFQAHSRPAAVAARAVRAARSTRAARTPCRAVRSKIRSWSRCVPVARWPATCSTRIDS